MLLTLHRYYYLPLSLLLYPVDLQGGPKCKSPPNSSTKIVLKPANEIRFVRQIKVSFN